MGPIDFQFLSSFPPDFIISYGYKHVIKKDVIDMYGNKIINLHISFLPWNRGTDPNFWSFIEDTPKGVTIHYVDEGIDTGGIIAQQEVHFVEKDTLRTSYDKLQSEIQTLFRGHWGSIREGKCDRKQQQGEGSTHKSTDKKMLSYLLTKGWDTPYQF